MTTFVLIHGACHGAWCWERVTPLLEARGHTAVAIDLPGQGDDPTPIADCSLAANVAAVRRAVEARDEPVVLVGHSLGGVTISQTAEEIPDRIASLVYLTAFMIRDGESQRDRVGEMGSESLARMRQMTDDGAAYLFAGPEVQPTFYHLCSDEDFARAAARLRPQPLSVGGAALRLTPEKYGQVRRVYLQCSEDQGFTLPFQQKLCAEQPCAKVVSIPADHSPFYSMPDRLVAALEDAAA